MRAHGVVEFFHFLFIGARIVTDFGQGGGLAVFTGYAFGAARKFGNVTFFGLCLRVFQRFLFVGDGFLPDTADTDKLLLFVHNGGRAFITTNAVPNYLLERVAVTICDTTDNGDDEDNFYHSFQSDYADSAT